MLRGNIRVLREMLEAVTSPEDIVTKLRSDIAPLFKGWEFYVGVASGPGYDTVNVIHVEFYRVPEGSGGLTKVRAEAQIQLAIVHPVSKFSPKYWKKGEPVPEKLEARVVRAEGTPTFRRISSTPEKVISAVTKWFRANRDALTGEGQHAY